eukprot:6201091-Pleurochrysis_carterae.AAC.1
MGGGRPAPGGPGPLNLPPVVEWKSPTPPRFGLPARQPELLPPGPPGRAPRRPGNTLPEGMPAGSDIVRAPSLCAVTLPLCP